MTAREIHVYTDETFSHEGGEEAPPKVLLWTQTGQLDRCAYVKQGDQLPGQTLQCPYTATWYLVAGYASSYACVKHVGRVAALLTGDSR